MKAVILLVSGIADFPVDALEGRTPLQVARKPHLDEVARTGRVGLVRLVPEGLRIASESAVLSVLGYDPRRERVSRGGLEALGLGVPLGPHDLAFRMNFVATFRDRLVDVGAGRIGTAEARRLVEALQEALGDERLSFHAGLGYRNLLVLRGGAELQIETVPPPEVHGQPVDEHLPYGRDAHVLVDAMERAALVLAEHDVNRVRLDLGENPADRIWPWGGGGPVLVEPFALRTGRSLAVVAAVPLLTGLARAAGATRVPVEGATGSFDTDHAGKARAAVAALETHDVVLVHVAAANEASHEADPRLKVKVIEDLDRLLVGPLVAAARARGDTRLLVTTDHTTSVQPNEGTSTHVPFSLWGPGFVGRRNACWNEADAEASDLCIEDGHGLLDLLLKEGPVRPRVESAADGRLAG